jgi:hypothetical protein
LGVAPDGIGSYYGVKKTKLRHIGKREMDSMAFVKLDVGYQMQTLNMFQLSTLDHSEIKRKLKHSYIDLIVFLLPK